MKLIAHLFLLAALLCSPVAHAEKITIAAASDLKFALDEIVSSFRKANPGDEIEVVYGSSGKLQTQIQQGAPYDLYFAADIAYARSLQQAGFAESAPETHAFGRIVLWSATLDARQLTLENLTDPTITRIAIANPRHAPYGKRAMEALQAAGVWEKIQSKLIYGENIAHTAQFVQTGNAQVGIIALALVLNPELAGKGGYWLIPEKLHAPLEQGFIITRRAAGNALARRFAAYMHDQATRSVMRRYGFLLPGETANNK
ncbi:MAG TPA: molybdate ABC transporter substrate-binding protein [Rhodocyclaceae bacterium]|nr:molybdate ABC transporter substrate-binding protein [Rhodocyclaceae bacterium]